MNTSHGNDVPELTVKALQTYAGAMGINLETTEDLLAPLYCYVDSNRIVRYIGKAESTNGRRHKDQDRWFGPREPLTELRVGMEAAISERNLKRVLLDFQRFDSSKAQQTLAKWEGPDIDAASEFFRNAPNVAHLEQFGIRVNVHTGTASYNSQHASMWERPLGSPIDTAAQVAVATTSVRE